MPREPSGRLAPYVRAPAWRSSQARNGTLPWWSEAPPVLKYSCRSRLRYSPSGNFRVGRLPERIHRHQERSRLIRLRPQSAGTQSRVAKVLRLEQQPRVTHFAAMSVLLEQVVAPEER